MRRGEGLTAQIGGQRCAPVVDPASCVCFRRHLASRLDDALIGSNEKSVETEMPFRQREEAPQDVREPAAAIIEMRFRCEAVSILPRIAILIELLNARDERKAVLV